MTNKVQISTNEGTSGQVLTSNGAGTAPTMQDAAGGGASEHFLGRVPSNTLVSSGAFTKVTNMVADINENSNFDTATDVYTAPSDGTYQINFVLGFSSISANAVFYPMVYINGSSLVTLYDRTSAFAGWSASGAIMVELAADDEISLYYYVSTGSPYIAGGTDYRTYLSIHKTS